MLAQKDIREIHRLRCPRVDAAARLPPPAIRAYFRGIETGL